MTHTALSTFVSDTFRDIDMAGVKTSMAPDRYKCIFDFLFGSM